MILNFIREIRAKRPIFFTSDNGIEFKILDKQNIVISELFVEINRSKILTKNFECSIENISKTSYISKYRIRNSSDQIDIEHIEILPNEFNLLGAVLISFNAKI